MTDQSNSTRRDDEQDSDRLIKRHAWMLFTDLNTRFNILMEECAHLQDMVWGMLSDLEASSSKGGGQAQADDEQRIEPFKKEDMTARIPWSLLPARQRALRSLYNYLGSLYLAIESNQETCREQFHVLCRTWQPPQFFWFISQRALFIRDQFGIYTGQLEHAQFKLIQIAENIPGSLPQPTLLRRWNSALFGDFLSAYSRHVDWETAMLAYFERGSGRVEDYPDPDFAKERAHEYFIHSWGHVADSRVRSHEIRKRTPDGQTWRFRSIRSAFFYLEMPLLFPLLYHECAHMHLEDGDAGKGFFGARNQLTNDLFEAARKEEPRLPQNRDVWHALTGEIWADLIAVALCGVGYVAALAMQLFGSNEAVFFQTGGVPIDGLGAERHRVYEVPAIGNEQVFWEVRLRLAIAVCNDLHNKDLGKHMLDWIHGLSSTIERYDQGGAAVFAFSVQHAEHWRYRRECSDKIVDTALERLQKGSLSRLKGYVGAKAITTAYRLPQGVGKLIREAVKGLHQGVFGGAPSPTLEEEPPSPDEERQERIEEISLRAKWCFADGAMKKLDEEISLRAKWCFAGGAMEKLDNMGYGDDKIIHLTKTYANRIRNDGSGAFRIAVECLLARFSATDAIADAIIGRPANGFDVWMRSVLPNPKDYDAFKVLLCDRQGLDSHENKRWKLAERTTIASWLKLRKYATGDRFRRWLKQEEALLKDLNLPLLLEKLDCWLEEHVVSALKGDASTRAVFNAGQASTSSHGNPEWFPIAPLGTISLGVIWPHYVATHKGATPFAKAMEAVRSAYCENPKVKQMNKDIEAMRIAFTSASDFKIPEPCFLPLIGQYAFLLYRDHLTPVERQHESPIRVQALLKPRAVLQVLGKATDLLCSQSSEDRGAGTSETMPPEQETPTRNEGAVLSVSLIEFAYRWQAYELRRQLKALPHEFPDATLFLSSGWETCILVLVHQEEADFWKVLDNETLHLGSRCEHIQTYFGVRPERFDEIAKASEQNEASKLCSAGPAQERDTGISARHFPLPRNQMAEFFQEIAECTGRDDFTVRWRAKTVGEMFERLCRLPQTFWKRTDRLAISCRQRVDFSTDKASTTATDKDSSIEFAGNIVRLGSFGRRWRENGDCDLRG